MTSCNFLTWLARGVARILLRGPFRGVVGRISNRMRPKVRASQTGGQARPTSRDNQRSEGLSRCTLEGGGIEARSSLVEKLSTKHGKRCSHR